VDPRQNAGGTSWVFEAVKQNAGKRAAATAHKDVAVKEIVA
jgi:hypothetical protein